MEFLELQEQIHTEAANVREAFSKLSGANGDGARVRSLAERGRRDPRYMQALVEASDFVADLYTGRKPAYLLREALTTSDFPLLFGDIIDRQVLANYEAWPTSYQNYCKMATVADFREVKRFEIFGGESTLAPVNQQAEYPESKLTEAVHKYSVAKYGRRIPFAWETMINDDLQALQDVPQRFGRAAKRTEEKLATTLFVDVNGPDASFFSSGNANIVTGSPALSVAALQTAMQVLAAQKDEEGEPIVVTSARLVVPPALEITALNVLNALQIWFNDAGGTSDERLIAVNWMKGRVQLDVNPYIPIVASSSHGNSSWFIFANPDVGKPALEFGHLRGHETPELYMKSPNAIRIGAGLVPPMEGDFDTDSIQYKVRHTIGGGQMNPKMAVASHG
jgi:hypothetical protein